VGGGMGGWVGGRMGIRNGWIGGRNIYDVIVKQKKENALIITTSP
jgi:hypothetical protein